MQLNGYQFVQQPYERISSRFSWAVQSIGPRQRREFVAGVTSASYTFEACLNEPFEFVVQRGRQRLLPQGSFPDVAFAETFAHPLVEAMSSGLPVVASDLAVHREICGQAASYFPRFSAESLATEVIKLAEDDALRATMSRAGLARSKDFSWSWHVDELLALAAKMSRLPLPSSARKSHSVA